MSKEFAKSLSDLELGHQRRDDAAEISSRYGLPIEVAERIVEISASIDQAHAIAELMR